MHPVSFCGIIVRQIQNQFKKLFQNEIVQANTERLKKFLKLSRENLQQVAENSIQPRALRYELCESRIVLDAYPYAGTDGGDESGSGFEDEVGIPVWVDGNFEFGNPTAQFPFGRENTFLLESNPSATKTIYLDYDGFHSQNNWWGHNINFPAFDRNGNPNVFNDAELSEIQKQFLHVVEDFLPFDVNVTTKDPGTEALRKSGAGDVHWGVRAVNTQYTDGFGQGTGGIAHLNSFDANIDNPVFSFNKGATNGGMTNSHEIGHALGLRHDGLGGSSYHPGVGSGVTGWGPIMGAPFGKNLVQWSNGDYTDSTNTEDDLTIITRSRNGFGFRADDHGNTRGTATAVDVSNIVEISSWGIIERNTDLDFFSFASGPGNISINIDALANNASLDIEAKLYDASGNLLATSNPTSDIDASFNLSVTGGSYFISVDGTGKAGVYSDYGSLGYYEISGLVVDPVNDPPTLNSIDDITLPEDSPEQTVSLSGITAGPNEVQPLRITATSSNTSLIPNPTVQYTSDNTTGSIKFQPVGNQNGSAIITVTVEDGGYDLDLSTKADNASFLRTFLVTVTPLNDPPTLDALDDMILAEDAPEQTVDLTGITDGDEGLQPLKVTAVSSNTGLIAHPTIDYTSPNTTGTLKFTPTADLSGISIITVTVEDGGNDNDLSTTGDNASFFRSFIVRINAENDKPTLAAIPDQTLQEDESRTLDLTGITAGGGEVQPLSVWATSSNTALMANPVVRYTSDNTTAELDLVPVPNAFGSTEITVFVEDGGLDGNLATKDDNETFSQAFTVDVIAENDLPTLFPLRDKTLNEDAGLQEILLTGISAGGGENQPLDVTVTSSNQLLVSNQRVDYDSADPTGLLKFATNANRFGSTVITVTVEDGGLDGDLGTKGDNGTFSQSFQLDVNPVNDAPRVTLPTNFESRRDQGVTEIRMTGIDAGPFENQPLRFTVTTDKPGLITDLQVDYTNPDRIGVITFDTLGQIGHGKIFVRLEDGGPDGNLQTPGDNQETNKVINVSMTVKSTAYAATDRTTFGFVSGVFGNTYWKNHDNQSITETEFGQGDRSRLDHRWKFDVAPGRGLEFVVHAKHTASNEQFHFEYQVVGTSTWKEIVTTNQNASRKYYTRVTEPELANGGSLWIRVRDTYRGQNDRELASLNIEKLFVLSRGLRDVQPAVNAFVFDSRAGEQGNDKAQFRFQLADRNRLDHDLDVYYSVGGTTSSGDYREVLSGVKTIKAGNLMARLIITPKNDRLLEGNESLSIRVKPDSEYRITGSPNATVIIRDNDQMTYEANGEASYLGRHLVHYPQSQFKDGQNEVIFESKYGNQTMMNHQWRFDVAGQTNFIVRGKMDVPSNSFVDDFAVAYSTNQKTWKGLGVLKYGQSLVLDKQITVPDGTENIWIRVADRYRAPNDTHIARVSVSYLQLMVRPNVIGEPLLFAPESNTTSPFSRTSSATRAYVESGLTGRQDSGLTVDADEDFQGSNFDENIDIEREVSDLAILSWHDDSDDLAWR